MIKGEIVAFWALITLDLGRTDKRNAFYKALKNKNWVHLSPAICDAWQVKFGPTIKIAQNAKNLVEKRLDAASKFSGKRHYRAAICVSEEKVQLLNI